MRSLVVVVSLALGASMVACGASDATPIPTPDAGVDAATTVDPKPAFEAQGFSVLTGSFGFLDLSDCCSTNCSGNNPTSPYGAFYVPKAPGQTAANGKERPDGLSPTFHLREDEAIVFVGPTPPNSAYFGFTPYLMDRQAQASRRSVFASLSETLNHLAIGVEGSSPFAARTAIIAAGDRATVDRARSALVASGVQASAINVLTFDPTYAKFGLDEASDTFGVLFRMALVEDPAKRDAYIANPGGALYRLTPKAQAAPQPLPAPTARTKASSPTETEYLPGVQRLGDAIAAKYAATYAAQPLLVDDGVPDPVACIQGTAFCAGDNRDTNYPGTLPRVLFASDDDFYVVYGVDHTVVGKTTYANASVYAVEKLVGLLSVTSDAYRGTATDYVPADPLAPKLYAWKFARHCDGEQHCTVVPKGACPTGIENGALGTLTFRTYLEPSTKTAPLSSALVRDRVTYFKKK